MAGTYYKKSAQSKKIKKISKQVKAEAQANIAAGKTNPEAQRTLMKLQARRDTQRQAAQQQAAQRENRPVMTSNGRQAGLTTTQGMQQAGSGANEYIGWYRREYGRDMDPMRQMSVRNAFREAEERQRQEQQARFKDAMDQYAFRRNLNPRTTELRQFTSALRGERTLPQAGSLQEALRPGGTYEPARTETAAQRPGGTYNSMAQRSQVQRPGETYVPAPAGSAAQRPGGTYNQPMTAGSAQAAQRAAGRSPMRTQEEVWGDFVQRQLDKEAARQEMIRNIRQEDVNSFSGWQRDLGKEYKKGGQNVTAGNVTHYLSEAEEAIRRGVYDTSEDWRLHSNRQKEMDLQEARAELEEAQRQAMATSSEDVRRALQEENRELNKRPGTYLDVNGLNVGNLSDADNIKKRPEDYDRYREDYDPFIYDAVHGQGAYSAAVEAMETDQDVTDLENEIDRMWDRLEKGEMHLYDEETAEERESRINSNMDLLTGKNVTNLQEKIRGLEADLERENILQRFAENAPAAPDPEEQALKLGFIIPEEELNGSGLFVPETMPDEWFLSDMPSDSMGGRSERDIYNSYFQSGQTKEAKAFLEALLPVIGERRARTKEYYDRETARQEIAGVDVGWIAGLGSSLLKPVASALEGVDMIGSLLGVDGSGDINSQWHQLGNQVRNIRDERGNVWDEAAVGWFGPEAAGMGKKYNGAFYSIMDNVVAMGTGKLMTAALAPEEALKATTRAVQWIMSTGAASDDFAERISNGMDPDKAAVYAIGTGVIEAITEKYSVEQLLNPDVKDMLGNWRQIAGFLGKNIIAEGSEEVASDALGMVMDDVLSTVYGHESEFKKKYNSYLDRYKDENTAMKMALWDVTKQFGESFYFGGLSGLIMSGGRVAINSAAQHRIGRTVSENRNLEQLLKVGRGMKEGSRSRAMTDRIDRMIKEGKTPSNTQIGKIAQNMVTEIGEERSGVIKDTIRRNMQQELEAKGVENPEDYAEIISRNLFEGNTQLSREDRSALAKEQAAIDVWQSYNKNEETEQKANLAEEIEEATKKQNSLMETIGELTSEQVRNTSAIAAEVERSVRETRNAAEAITNLQERNANLISESYAAKAQELLKSDPEAKKNKNYLDDVVKVRLAAMSLAKEMPQTKLSAETAQALFDEAKREFDEIDESRVLNQAKIVPGKGVATFDGAEYGTAEWDEKLKGLTKQQRNQMGALGEIVTRMGNRLNLVNDPENKGIYGFEQSDGTITINVAGMNRSGLGHHMLVTMSHELTHWLEQNSREGYGELRQFLMDSLRNKGQNVEQMLVDTINNQRAVLGEGSDVLDLNGAMAELVAKSCENLLSSESFRDQLAQENPSLYSRIKTFVKDFTARIRAAIGGMNESLSREARALMDETERIAKLWLGAREEALGREVTGETEQGGESVRFSTEQRENTEVNKPANKEEKHKLLQNIRTVEIPFDKGAYRLETIPEIYTKLFDVGQLDLTIEPRHTYNTMVTAEQAKKEGMYRKEEDDHYHGLGVSGLLEAIEALDDPELIMNGTGKDKAANPRIVMAVNTNHNGKLMGVIEFYNKGRLYDKSEQRTHALLTIYDKNNLHRYIQVAEQRNLVLYEKNQGDPAIVVQFDNGQRSSDLDNNLARFNEYVKRWKGNRGINYSVEQMDNTKNELLTAWSNARDQLAEARENFEGKKAELKEWTNRMMEARDNGTWDELLPEYQKWEKGYTEVNNALQEAQDKYKKANQAFDDYIEQRDVTEEQSKIEKSGLTEPEWRRKQAVKEFGYTADWREAGYLLPNGRLLNFSGSKTHIGMRGEDHRGIGRIYASSEMRGSAAMVKFMGDGNIRVMAETPGIDIISTTEPTKEQYAAIRNMARRFAGEEYFNVDFTDERGNTVDSIEYDGRVNPERVVNDIKTFYRTGTAPQQSVVSQFHYSVEQSPDMEVDRFMLGLNESSLGTLQERTMLRQYKELHGTIDVLNMKIRDREAMKRQLEAKQKKEGKLSAYDRDQMRKINNWLNNDRNRLDRMEAELVKVTGDKGYAKLMMQQDSKMRNLVQGLTAEGLISTVEKMQRQLDEIDKTMQERAEKLKQLSMSEAVLRIRAQFNSAGLKRIAADLKKQMNSTLANSEIENRLALIALKMKDNKFDSETANELVDMILGRMKGGTDSYVISALRGRKLTLSEAQLKELKANNSSLKELNAELAGTGIRFVRSGHTTLEHSWGDICDEITSLDRNTDPLRQVDTLMNLISSEKNQMFDERFNDMNVQGTTEMVLKAAAELLPEITGSERSLSAVRDVLKFAQEISGQTKEAAEEMSGISERISRLKKTGQNAMSGANKLTGDVSEAIEYFNELAEQSEAALWKRERLALIDQLKSENTENLLKEQEKWKQKIEKDKAARQQMESNLQLRRKITTNVSRIRKLIMNETDLKNVPEHMKGLARAMLGRIVNNDLAGRKITGIERKDLMETRRVLDAMEQLDGEFSPDDLRLMSDEEAQAMVLDAMAELENGIGFYNAKASGNLMANLQGFRNALEKISDAVSTITGVINAERSVSFLDRQIDIADAAEDVRKDFDKSRFKGERAGYGRKVRNVVNSSVFYGNMTPVYYFKMLRNGGMDAIWKDLQAGENRSGLETAKAQNFLADAAEETNYREWADSKFDVVLGGQQRKVTIGNMMELYAIWKREKMTNPEMSQHLAKGGIYIEEDSGQDKGKPRRETKQQRPIRVTDEEVQAMYNQMSGEQKQYIDKIVGYLSNEMSDLGNEASMRMYGIRKYKEKWYFPMKVWDGVKSARSDRGISGTDENRAAHRSFSLRRMHMAQNALVIGDFTTDAVSHIVEMINYNTMAPAIENMNKVLNFQFTEGENPDAQTKRNLRVMFEEAYGKEALKYLETFMKDLNGGVVQDQRRTLRDRALSMFKKNAVAGSLSVALQQPLSYIRAATMISPKYLTEALNPVYWKGSYAEMMKYSGVAVIKDMGRFDMNFGQSAKDFITPKTGKNLYETVSDWTTKAPEWMDRATWTRMWSAVKAEQKAKNPGADVTSEAFLRQVADRFNDVVRQTQVYDSVLVKSSNMRSQNLGMKLLTSFMAEPTLSLNLLADAVGSVRAGDSGAVAKAGRAAATFLLSAVCQAAVKGAMGSGRTPEEEKTWLENFLNKLQYNLQNEANPLSLIPGYSDIVELFKRGELKDDAMGAIGKVFTVWDTLNKIGNGKGRGWYRDIEDTAGQLMQLFTKIPAKNLMRDGRAIYNWITQEPYAKRETSRAVLKQQAIANLVSGDNLIGALNAKLGEAGFVTTNKAYYARMYSAEKAGNKAEADSIKEYLTLGKGASEDAIESGLRTLTKQDPEMSYEEKIEALRARGVQDKDLSAWITKEFKEGKVDRTEAETLYVKANPDKDRNDAYFHFEQMDWETETGNDTSTTDYFRLNDAIAGGSTGDVSSAVSELKAHGYTEEKIGKHIKTTVGDEYKDGNLTKKQAEDMLKKFNSMTADEIFWMLDLIDYKKQTGNNKASGVYYRMKDALAANRNDDISKQVKTLLEHGYDKKKIKDQVNELIKEKYMTASVNDKVKLKDAMMKAYKAAGYTQTDAQKVIDGWMKESKKKKK